jgi:hypothetical protein
MINRPKVSSLLPNQVPEFVREEYTTFIEFLKAYYEFIDQNYDTQFPKLRDLDTTLDSFIEHFKNELAVNIPYSVINERFLLEKIKDQYLAKGSEASFKLLFKLLFNKEVVVDYPSKQILRASDGRWNQDVSVFAYVNAGNPDDVVGKMVDVVTATRILRVQVDKRQYVEIEVDNIVQISENVYEFFIDRRFFGQISVGDKLRYSNTFEATVLPTTSTITIQRGGKRFKLGELYSIVNGQGKGSIVKVSRVNSTTGAIESLEFVKYGVGYTTDFTATLLPYGGLSANSTAGATGLVIAGSAPNTTINFGETTNGFFEQGIINKTDYNVNGYWDGTYVGDTIREFFADNKYTILDPDEPAVIKITLNSLAKYPGYYTTNDGFLDDAIFIQDSRYYQAFAYVLKIDERLDTYRSAVKTLLHPAGMALFGEFDVRNEFDTGTDLEFALKYLFVSLQDEVLIGADYATKLFGKNVEDSIDEPTDSNIVDVTKPLYDHNLNDDLTPDDNTITPSEVTYDYDYDALSRDGISTIDFGKRVNSSLLYDGTTLDNNSVITTEAISYFDITKRLDETVTPSDTVGVNGARTDPIFDFSKDLSGGHYILNGVTTDSEAVLPTDVYASLLSKPLGTQYLYDGTTADENTVYLETTADTTALLFNKRVNSSLLYDGVTLDDNTVTPSESISAIDFGKALTETQTLSDTTGTGSTRTMPYADISKALATHLLYDNVTSDTNLVTMVDITGTGSTRTVPYIVLNKSITNTTVNYDGDLDDETVMVTGSGYLWLNPYTPPYPLASSYFSNDGGNYVEGESAFTG